MRILSSRSRVPAAKAEALLRCYAKRLPPGETAQHVGLSLNTVYEQYSRIRWRLIEVGYYRDAAYTTDEPGLAEETKATLRRRRGLGPGDIYAHAAEVIVWAEKWPPGDVLRHLRKIIALTGPIDQPLELTDIELSVVSAYVRYAQTTLIHNRVVNSAENDETNRHFAERTRLAVVAEWRIYRAAVKKAERQKNSQR